MKTPAEKLGLAIEASKLANDNFNNYELYCVLMHRACMLKLDHAKSVGEPAVKIIMEKYGNWINDNSLVAKSLEMAISNKFGIGVEVTVSNIGVSMAIDCNHSATTLLKAFRNHNPLMKAHGGRLYTMFVETSKPQLLLS